MMSDWKKRFTGERSLPMVRSAFSRPAASRLRMALSSAGVAPPAARVRSVANEASSSAASAGILRADGPLHLLERHVRVDGPGGGGRTARPSQGVGRVDLRAHPIENLSGGGGGGGTGGGLEGARRGHPGERTGVGGIVQSERGDQLIIRHPARGREGAEGRRHLSRRGGQAEHAGVERRRPAVLGRQAGLECRHRGAHGAEADPAVVIEGRNVVQGGVVGEVGRRGLEAHRLRPVSPPDTAVAARAVGLIDLGAAGERRRLGG
jgi:hypothetical protein